ncbi:MAG: hypothetical protein HUK20_09675 [Fibrobacter sp.]|nr:hypothetical protein [Fibrobacter sp.]
MQVRIKRYETPSTTQSLVELENGICAGSANTQNQSQNENHEVNEGFDFTYDKNEWDD